MAECWGNIAGSSEPSRDRSDDRTRTSPEWNWKPAVAAALLAVLMTWPLAGDMGSLGRTGVSPDRRFGTNADGMFSLWNVS